MPPCPRNTSKLLEFPAENTKNPLDEILREGARKMLIQAIQEEVVQRQLKLPVQRQLELPVATSRRGASDVVESQLVDRTIGLDT